MQPRLDIVSIADHGAQLSEPFTMIDLAQIDDLTLSLFLCQGTLPYHRHLDQDELFLVHSGAISLDSDWGTVILRAGELCVLPKSLGHRSSSLLRSLVLLLQPRLAVERRNGDRRLFLVREEQKRLEKVSVTAMGRQLAAPFRPIVLAHVDTYAVQLTLCEGAGDWQQANRQATLVLCCGGQVRVETPDQRLRLDSGEMVVVPSGVAHQVSSTQRATLIGVARHPPPGLAPPTP